MTDCPFCLATGHVRHEILASDAAWYVIARFADEPLAGTGIRHALKQEANRRPSRR